MGAHEMSAIGRGEPSRRCVASEKRIGLVQTRVAKASISSSWQLHCIRRAAFEKAAQGETTMDGDYVFLCGVMWCAYGQQDAGRELLRAANSADPDLSALAVAMLAQQPRSFQATEA